MALVMVLVMALGTRSAPGGDDSANHSSEP
jgi:hypothetical protein